MPERVRPAIMGKIINEDKIIFKPRHAKHRRCPDITMNEFKGN